MISQLACKIKNVVVSFALRGAIVSIERNIYHPHKHVKQQSTPDSV